MKDSWKKDRQIAIKRYLEGEKPGTICKSLGYSEQWFYKWLKRYREGDEQWYQDKSCCPHSIPSRTTREIEEIVKLIRLHLYNSDLFYGAQSIAWEMEELGVQQIPSVRTINRILSRNDLTHRRTGRYEPKGKKYPKLKAQEPGDVHQTDIVGPCYLSGPVRFYSLNSIDIATGRCGIEPMRSFGGQVIVDALWAIWSRLGIPKSQQVDNEAAFYGSQRYPRGMGKLIRLCLLNGTEPYFIPQAEPWRNGVVEKFNDHWRQKFYHRVKMYSMQELKRESLEYEQKHNSKYRYSKLGGKTPMESLSFGNVSLRFPSKPQAPRIPLTKPRQGRYHVIRFIRSDGILNIFGEKFSVPSEAVYEYVQATIDVTRQRLRLYLDGELIDEQEYRIR